MSSKSSRLRLSPLFLLALGGLLSTGATASFMTLDEANLYMSVLQREFPDCFLDAVVEYSSATSETAGSALECQDLCREDSQCVSFTFDSTENSCLLMSGSYKSVRSAAAISGPKACSRACREEGMPQAPIVRVVADGSIGTLDECLKLCEETEPCALAAFDYRSDTCTLTARKTGETVAMRGVVTAPKRCEAFNDSSAAEGVSFTGSTVSDPSSQDSWQACRETSRTNPLALYWSWNSTDKTCKLFDSSGRTSLIIEQGSVGGPAWPRASPCVLEDTRFSGDDDSTTVTYAMSYQHCRFLCQRDLGCIFYSYQQEGAVCRLLNLRSVNAKTEAAEGWVSGPETCLSSDWCVLPGTLFRGGTISDQEAPDADTCRTMCRSNSRCVVWGFNKHRRLCSLMTDVALSAPETNIYFVSGLGYCGTSSACHQQDIDFGTSRHLEDLAEFTTQDACSDACFRQSRCYFYSLLDNKTCRLYSKTIQQRAFKGSLSGPAVC